MFENTMIYLIGFPGTGKYTIAKLFATQGGVRLIDNQLINNPLFAVLRVDGKTPLPKGMWDSVGKIWQIVLDAMVNLAHPQDSFVLTNALFDHEQGDHQHFKNIQQVAEKRGATFVPVRLFVSDKKEHAKRITMPEREARMKQTDARAVAHYTTDRLIQLAHENTLDLDTSTLSPQETFEAISAHIQKIKA